MAGDGADDGGRILEARILAGAVAVAVFLVAFHRAMPQLHALNFSTAGPGPSAALVLALVTGWTIPLAAGTGAGSGRRPAALAASAGGALALSFVPHAEVAVTAGLGAIVLLTPALAALATALGVRVGASLAAGVLLHQALRVGTAGAPLTATGLGRALALVLSLALVGSWGVLLARGWAPELPEAGLADGAPLLVAVLAEAVFLGSAGAVATWWAGSALPVAAASAAGLAAGGLAAAAGRVPGRGGTWAWAGVLVLAAGDLVLLGAIGGLAAAPAQAAVVLLAARAAGEDAGSRRSARAAGGRVAAAQGAAVLLLMGVVWAGNWPFVPLGGPFRGRAGPLLAGLVVLPGLLAVPWRATAEEGVP